MKPELLRFGADLNPVVILDCFSGRRRGIVEIAAAMAPFPPSGGNVYPGLRRVITKEDDAAWLYITQLLSDAAPYIGGAFDADSLYLLEASFSIVTAAPDDLAPEQRAPHFDSTDPSYIAVIHYLSDMPSAGTAFYRQRATGIETVRENNVDLYVNTAKRVAREFPKAYIAGSNEHYEEIGRIEGAPDRLAVYRGAMLHSGVIPPEMPLSSDPRVGRLTANLFIRLRQLG
ncbi:MAG: DUF6445 family protein [Pseudomonadota bacterium]